MRRDLSLALGAAMAALVLLLSGHGMAAAQSGRIELFQIHAPGSEWGGIAAGPDGNVWFTEGGGMKIGRITLDGQVTEYPLPFADSRPNRIAAGPDGNLWFTAGDGAGVSISRIGRIDTGGQVTEFFAPTAKGVPDDITAGPDGAVWFTERLGDKIGRIAPDGQITEFATPTGKSGPQAIASGPDGNVWFTEESVNKVARITPAGTIAEFALPPSREGPRGITSSSDGNVWLTEFGRNAIARVATDGAVTEYRLPGPSHGPEAIAADVNGDLWFTESYNTVWRMTPTGRITEFAIRPKGIRPIDIAAGPDGNVWFIATGGPSGTTIGRIEPSAPPAVPSASAAPSLHGTPAIGQRITAHTGSWSNNPTGYSFRWERCDRQGSNCAVIRGHRESVVLTRAEVGHTIRAQVGVGNAAGTAYLTTASTGVVHTAPAPLRVEIESSRVRVGGDGKARLELSCEDGPRGAFCTGTVLIDPSRKRRRELGHARYRLVTGNHKLIPLPLDREALALLTRAPRHRLRVRATATLWGGHPASREAILGR